ncbi:MAG: DNA mismatch repair endonuclease MutL [bacterium]|nr:DNA mismatch repair endonuclease MutL [bacterium]
MSKDRNRIKILPDHLVDVIAAGEVVERPASVVKELVENAIDAGAGSVRVHLIDGGRGKIQVVDDGAGMDEDDCLMAIERHATSKVAALDDLRHLRTLGFRGEALPSIASVGYLKLESWDGKSPSGTRVVVNNGKLVTVEPVGRARGTTVTLEGLFRKLPARRKFMRTGETETAWCLTAVEDAALANPGIFFSVTSNGTLLLDMPPASTLRNRIVSLWGADISGRLLSLSYEGEVVTLEGLISPPTETFSRRARHRTVINNRPVRDPVLNKIISSALSGSWPAGRFPALMLSLVVDDDLVDVNVHPAKREVRFRRTEPITEAIRSAVSKIKAPVRTAYGGTSTEKHPAHTPAGETRLPFGKAVHTLKENVLWPPPVRVSEDLGAGSEPGRVLGQVMGTYILLEGESGLHIIDQHAAHERIVFNRLLSGRSGEKIPVQILAVPLVLTLSPSEAASLLASHQLLNSFGFEIGEFGPNTVRVTAVPSDLKGSLVEELLRQLADGSERILREPEDVALAVSRWACRESIMAGRKLSEEEIKHLVRDLDEAESGFSCPHGRPTRITLNSTDLEKLFGRR